MKRPLKVLHIEDSLPDSALVEHMLRGEGFACEFNRVETHDALIQALQQSQYDLILSDCTLPQYSGLRALEVVHALKPQIPFIFVSGTIGEEKAIESLQNGATDYVLKHKLSRLVPAVKRALSEARERSLRLAMEKRLRQTRQLEAIGTLAGGLAHDFRNLLQSLKMGIAMLPLKSGDPEEIRKIAETLDKTANRGTDMMQELLVFGRKTKAQLNSIDIAAQVDETVKLLRPGLPADISLVTQLNKGLPPIFADAGQIDRVLTNLIINARDAMPAGGTITVTGKMVQLESNASDVLPMSDATYLCLTVADTGTGMDEATLQHVFEPFFTTKPIGKGTGLGLSVVFGLMEVHNGFIDILSVPGQGTMFSLFFPLPRNAEIPAKEIEKVMPSHLVGRVADQEMALN